MHDYKQCQICLEYKPLPTKCSNCKKDVCKECTGEPDTNYDERCIECDY